MRRRELIRGALAAGLGASATRLLGADGRRMPFARIAQDVPVAPPLGGPLIAQTATIAVWPGYPVTLSTFNSVYPSPTIRVQRGDVFDVTLDNQLAEEVNIHWHGLAVPADMDGHPMDVVQPGATRQYTFPVVDRAGTYWYHPHTDMKTASQVYRGLAGFFIVEDPAEAVFGLPTGAYDVPLLIQDRRVTADLSFTYAPTMMDMMTGYLGNAVLVNGVPDAQLEVAAAAYRFRLLNGSNARVYRVAFEDARVFHVIAGDGGLLHRPIPATEFFLSPGERAEFVVNFARSESGRAVRLVSLPFTGGGGGTQGAGFPLLRFRVRGSGPTPPLPAALVPLEPYARPQTVRYFVMEMNSPPVQGNFLINGLAFHPTRIDQYIGRNVLERWEVVNGSAHPHPFHVHATQFRVMSRSVGPMGPHELGWKDTVLVWPAEVVQLAVRFDYYPGMYVLHCHNLEHEDMGMMSNFMVT
jgi:FtsP/CotA-like multicopper oxidase with cupredoxin domain